MTDLHVMLTLHQCYLLYTYIGQTGSSSEKEKGGKPCCFAFIGIIIDY